MRQIDFDGRTDLSDIAGGIVSTQTLMISEGANSYNLDVNDVPQGVYFLKINDGVDTFYEKLIVQ